MFNHHDQADGLRRMMTKRSARIISVLSADGSPTQGWLTNLAASLYNQQHRLLLIQSGIAGWPDHNQSVCLQAVGEQKTTLPRAISRHALGFDRARFSENKTLTQPLSANLKTALDVIVKQIVYDYDTVMIEAQHHIEDGLTLPLMSKHELVIQMQRNEAGIKAAYTCIKRVCMQYGNQPFGVVVTAANQLQGQQYFMRLNQVCQQFLGVKLSFLGAIPNDDALQQSTAMGRSVVDAFPKAQATLAFKAVANSLDKRPLASASMAMA